MLIYLQIRQFQINFSVNISANQIYPCKHVQACREKQRQKIISGALSSKTRTVFACLCVFRHAKTRQNAPQQQTNQITDIKFQPLLIFLDIHLAMATVIKSGV
ncbi:Hypothetical_protein [Hexamita inflata]|uniref:Hypothetical_protein n=1 Tax=Hexamita inflata TaxID=28002 RepID=A0AA86UPM0_9EUKA|nr:Hypothetical protein HINF_LOCUS50864 [Hexamita inflata]